MSHASILVTGGAGFIGGCFVRQMLEVDDSSLSRLVNLDKLTYAGNLDSLEAVYQDPRHRFVEGGHRRPRARRLALTRAHPLRRDQLRGRDPRRPLHRRTQGVFSNPTSSAHSSF